MKKFLLLALVAIFFALDSQAQEIGVRISPSAFTPSAIDASFGISKTMRIHTDIGFTDELIGLEALFDFIYLPVSLGGDENFRWYAGVGGAGYHDGNDIDYNISLELGLEYQFKTPIVVGVDYRPVYWVEDNGDIDVAGFSLMARYVFGK